MNVNDFAGQSTEWLSGDGPMSDIVISSRLRLARNLAAFPFLSQTNQSQRKEILRTGAAPSRAESEGKPPGLRHTPNDYTLTSKQPPNWIGRCWSSAI